MSPPSTHREIILSALGGFLGIGMTVYISYALLGEGGNGMFLVASIGASSVLLFASPTSPLAQPWSLIGGSLISAVIGLLCAWSLSSLALAAASALALSIVAMFYLRCLHPPGGAVAIIAVLTHAQSGALGMEFVLLPVGLNIVLLSLFGWLINRWLLGREYPQIHHVQTVSAPKLAQFSDEDLEYALMKMGSYIDVSHDDLRKLYLHAREHAERK